MIVGGYHTSLLGVIAGGKRSSAPATGILLQDLFTGSAGTINGRAVPSAPQSSNWFTGSDYMTLNGSGQLTHAGQGASTSLAEINGDTFNLALPDATAVEVDLLVPDAGGSNSFAKVVVGSGVSNDHKLSIWFDRKNGSVSNQIAIEYQFGVGNYGYLEQAYTFGASMTKFRVEASSGKVSMIVNGTPLVDLTLAGFAGLMQFQTGAFITVTMRTEAGYTVSMDSITVEGLI